MADANPKRKAGEEAEDDQPKKAIKASSSKKTSAYQGLVNPKRIRTLRAGSAEASSPVLYWMSRDQRMADNWALLHAADEASKKGSPVAVVFNLVPAYLGAGARHWGFMLRGLRELEVSLKAAGIPFFLLKGDPVETIPDLVKKSGAGLLITDYSPLRLGRQWRSQVGSKLPPGVLYQEVDAHNVVPVWVASEKREIGARTLRPRIHGHLPEFLCEFPALPSSIPAWPKEGKAQPEAVDWEGLIKEVLQRGSSVPEVKWIMPGEAAGRAALDGPDGFLSASRLKIYSEKRNDPASKALSDLSPYLHYGQLAPQRAALEASKHKAKYKEAVEGFLEELVVRRELSDNFCHYTPDSYDNINCAAVWARDSLEKHLVDKREYLYTRSQFEQGKTHDELWNAAQLQLVHMGKMHGFMRMYWAKKILEWTNNPKEAIEVAIYLNDKYSLDGRDPSGYVGVMWSMVGIHDMGWTERAIFGKIRYMNYAGCKRKFKIEAYVAYVNSCIKKERASGPSANSGPDSKNPVGTNAASFFAPKVSSATKKPVSGTM
ncbi:hypothetical protein CEUSTIGMA_g99.t1 [Chlamydomonas eustigma]|uniref:Deoxyribodipyrimidine photo-lyase n=1 Tax=Chlamydomonas eustigma TaxID=1157962 RepID=A0A250WP94_9CHLO|nr:hypothetical protein CEUSTIGMA_g99.t1 [Chlamydomonas eustigma]|eukprot:GAX72643.1 hypothetical protein CEUSTIGMA_g99.t1 [Chlamydomonas eustigma]